MCVIFFWEEFEYETEKIESGLVYYRFGGVGCGGFCGDARGSDAG